MKIKGQRVYLRELTLKDAEGNYPNWLNDKEVCRYNSHGDKLYTKDMAKEYIKSVQNNLTCKVFAICHKKSDVHIGNLSLQALSTKNQSAELAIIMGEKEFWGKGLAKEACELLIDYGFSKLGLHRIYCGTSEENTPMQKLALSLGMELEGKRIDAMKKNGRFYNVLEYGLVKKK